MRSKWLAAAAAVALLALQAPVSAGYNQSAVVGLPTLTQLEAGDFSAYPFVWATGVSSINGGDGGLFDKVSSCVVDGTSCVQDSVGNYFQLSAVQARQVPPLAGSALDCQLVYLSCYVSGVGFLPADSVFTVSRNSPETTLLPTSLAGATYQTFSANTLALSAAGLQSYGETRTNYLLNSAAPATQTVSGLSGATYTLWVNGSGSARVSGCTVAPGSATQGVWYTFVGSGNCVVTVTGSLNEFQLEKGTTGSAFIPTAGAAVARAADVITANSLLAALLASDYTMLATLGPGITASPNSGTVLDFDHTNIPLFELNYGAAQNDSPTITTENFYPPAYSRKIVTSQASGSRTLVMNGGAEVTSVTPLAAPTNIYVGAFGSNFYLDGEIQELAVFTSQLTAPQRVALSGLNNGFTFHPFASASAIRAVATDLVTVGAVLAYEYTQPWTSMASVKCTGWQYDTASMIFTNATETPNFPGYEHFLINGVQRVRLINNVNTPHYIDVSGSTQVCGQPGTQHVLAATYDGSGLASGVKLYVDGVAETTSVIEDTLAAQTIVGGTQTFTVANQTDNDTFAFSGAMYYFQLFNVAKSSGFIAANSIVTTPPAVDADTALRYVFSEGTGTSTADSSGNGYTGTLSSSAMWLP